MYSRLSLNRTPKLLDFFIILLQMTAKNRSTVQQTAPTGAVCSTVYLYLATICVQALNITHTFRPVLRESTVRSMHVRVVLTLLMRAIMKELSNLVLLCHQCLR